MCTKSGVLKKEATKRSLAPKKIRGNELIGKGCTERLIHVRSVYKNYTPLALHMRGKNNRTPHCKN